MEGKVTLGGVGEIEVGSRTSRRGARGLEMLGNNVLHKGLCSQSNPRAASGGDPLLPSTNKQEQEPPRAHCGTYWAQPEAVEIARS